MESQMPQDDRTDAEQRERYAIMAEGFLQQAFEFAGGNNSRSEAAFTLAKCYAEASVNYSSEDENTEE